MAKTASLYARIEPEVKEQAEDILLSLGLSASTAINMFYKQIILQQGLPFNVKLPPAHPLDVSALTEEALSVELEKGYVDLQSGRRKEASQAFADMRKEYGL